MSKTSKSALTAYLQGILIGAVIFCGLLYAQQPNSQSSIVRAAQETCPETNGWTKIDSNDLSSYPVSGATAYCFKAGADNAQGCTGGLFNAIPSGGFVQPYCGLSHWSYYLGSVSPSPSVSTSPSPSVSPSPEPSLEPSPSPSASPDPSPSPSLDPSPSPSVSPTPTPTPSTTPGPSNDNSSSGSSTTSGSPSAPQTEGEVLGTYAQAGVASDVMMNLAGSLGGILTLAGSVLYGRRKEEV